MTDSMKKGDLALVTGVSGYLASWLAKDLLARGLRVRGTIRSLNDAEKVGVLNRLLPGIELCAADLRSSAGWNEAVAGARWVFHVASPQAVPSETDRTGGAVEGTEHLLRAAFASPSVQKIVVTSSEAAVAYGHPRTKQYFTEDDWTVLDGPTGGIDYMRSKTLAERRAWALAADLGVNPRNVPVSTINPSFIAGPSLVPWGRYSLETLRGIAEGRTRILPDLESRVVDVRDCARMHVAVMNDPSSNGHRHLCFAAQARMSDFAGFIRGEYAELGFSPEPCILSARSARLLSMVSRDVAGMYSRIGASSVYETKYPTVYRYEHTDLAAILRDSMESMLAHGWLKPVAEAHAA
ncbi:MAG TPA: NAD-dependent epimerase/dehydratase family protein [Polyangia bacterium]